MIHSSKQVGRCNDACWTSTAQQKQMVNIHGGGCLPPGIALASHPAKVVRKRHLEVTSVCIPQIWRLKDLHSGYLT